MNLLMIFMIVSFILNFSKDDINWNIMKNKFEFIVHILMNPQEYDFFLSLPTYLSLRAPKSATHKVTVPSDTSSFPHQTVPFL